MICQHYIFTNMNINEIEIIILIFFIKDANTYDLYFREKENQIELCSDSTS